MQFEQVFAICIRETSLPRTPLDTGLKNDFIYYTLLYHIISFHIVLYHIISYYDNIHHFIILKMLKKGGPSAVAAFQGTLNLNT